MKSKHKPQSGVDVFGKFGNIFSKSFISQSMGIYTKEVQRQTLWQSVNNRKAFGQTLGLTWWTLANLQMMFGQPIFHVDRRGDDVMKILEDALLTNHHNYQLQ